MSKQLEALAIEGHVIERERLIARSEKRIQEALKALECERNGSKALVSTVDGDLKQDGDNQEA